MNPEKKGFAFGTHGESNELDPTLWPVLPAEPL